MKISCNECKSKFKVSDEKLPPGTSKKISCPKCKNPIQIDVPEVEPAEFDEGGMDFFGFDEEEQSELSGGSERSFDFVEEEEKKALLCEEDEEVKDRIVGVLDVMEYHITAPKDNRDALKKLRYNSYDVIVVNENFYAKNPDANGILLYLQRHEMNVRREFFVTLISQRYRTMDQMAAFQKSVNIVVNVSHIDDFDKILRRGLADWDLFYRAYKDLKP